MESRSKGLFWLRDAKGYFALVILTVWNTFIVPLCVLDYIKVKKCSHVIYKCRAYLCLNYSIRVIFDRTTIPDNVSTKAGQHMRTNLK